MVYAGVPSSSALGLEASDIPTFEYNPITAASIVPSTQQDYRCCGSKKHLLHLAASGAQQRDFPGCTPLLLAKRQVRLVVLHSSCCDPVRTEKSWIAIARAVVARSDTAKTMHMQVKASSSAALRVPAGLASSTPNGSLSDAR